MEEVIEKILLKMKDLTELENETKTKVQISILIRKALNYMHREDFPEQLVGPFAEHLALKEMERLDPSIKSITEGDTKYELNVSRDTTEELLVGLKSQLNRFRKVGTL